MNGSRPAGTIVDVLLDHVPAAVAIFDTNMRYLACSRRWATDYGIEDQDIIGRSHYDVFPEVPDRWREIHRRALQGETLSCEEDPFPRQDGSLDWIRWEIAPWHDATGQIGGVVLFTNLVTTLRSQLVHAARVSAMATMASTLAHELNQPVCAMKNYVEGVRSLLAAPDPLIADALEQASLQATRAGDIVRQLRAFVERAGAEKKVFALATLIDEALELAKIGMPWDDIEITVSLDPHARSVLVERLQIEQVLVNLLRNAFGALEGSSIKAVAISSAVENDRYVRITVADTGKGLSPSLAKNLFSTFLNSSDEPTGLALSICRTIVEENGGRIWFEPGPDGGSLFHFTLPRPGQAT